MRVFGPDLLVVVTLPVCCALLLQLLLPLHLQRAYRATISRSCQLQLLCVIPQYRQKVCVGAAQGKRKLVGLHGTSSTANIGDLSEFSWGGARRSGADGNADGECMLYGLLSCHLTQARAGTCVCRVSVRSPPKSKVQWQDNALADLHRQMHRTSRAALLSPQLSLLSAIYSSGWQPACFCSTDAPLPSLKSVLRELYKKVHPDLFHDDQTARLANEHSFKLLQVPFLQ